MADTEIEEIVDQEGLVRRLGSLLPQQGFVSSFNTFEEEHPVWDDDDVKRVTTNKDRTPRRKVFEKEWIQNQQSHGCHDEATEVLTERGFVKWTDYNWTDKLGTMNPESGSLEFQQCLEKYVYDYDGEMYFSEHGSLDFVLTPNHRMVVRPWNEQQRKLSLNSQFKEIKDIGWYSGIPASTSGWTGIELERVSVDGSIELLGDDFVAMISLICSDGWAGGELSSVRNQVSYCCFNEKRYQMVSDLSRRIGFNELPGRKGVWIRTDAALAKWCRENLYSSPLKRAMNKEIPSVIQSVSEKQIRLFLDFFGDKTHSDEYARCFYSSSKGMIDSIQSLLLKIGSRSRVASREPRDAVMKDGRVIHGVTTRWECREWTSSSISITRKKNLATDHYKGNVFCASVGNGTLITRRNGVLLISGNSCNGYAGAGALSKARSLRGVQDKLKLSGAFIYSLINGGRDNGSALEDGLKVIGTHGSPPESFVPWNMIYPNQQPKSAVTEAKKHRGLAAYAVQTKQGFRTALAAGFPVIVAVHAGRNFQTLNSQGIAGADNGQGNHAIHCDDICIINGKEVYDAVNSWGANYGTEGRAYLTWDSFEQTFGRHTFYAIASTEESEI